MCNSFTPNRYKCLLRPVWQEGVICLLWLAGSRYIATGCVDGKGRIRDSLSGDCAKILCEHAGPIQSIAASSNGEFLVLLQSMELLECFEIADTGDIDFVNARCHACNFVIGLCSIPLYLQHLNFIYNSCIEIEFT